MGSVQDEKAALAQKLLNQSIEEPQPTDSDEALVTDGYMVQNLVPAEAEAEPPAYGDLRDQMQFSQPGLQADAAINGNDLPALLIIM